MKTTDKPRRREKRITCPSCSGLGTQFLKVTGDAPKPGIYLVQCFFCKGARKVTQAQIDALEREQNEWCNCPEPMDVDFYPDGSREDVTQHHWRCRKCGGITQIG